jgi:hypothetical protein
MHTNDRPYACPVADCGKSFTRQDVLARHVKGHETAAAKAAAVKAGDVEDLPAITPPPVQGQDIALDVNATDLTGLADVTGRASLSSLPESALSLALSTQGTSSDFLASSLQAPQDGLLFGTSNDFFASFPLDQGIWETIGMDWQTDPLDIFTASQLPSPPHSAPLTAESPATVAALHPFDAISRKWPKLGRIARLHTSARKWDDGQPWKSAYLELGTGIDLQPIQPPTPTFLSAAVASYFRHFSGSQPFLHEGSFDPQARTPLLVLATCATGARFMESAEADIFAFQMFERLGLLLQVRHRPCALRSQCLTAAIAALLVR